MSTSCCNNRSNRDRNRDRDTNRERNRDNRSRRCCCCCCNNNNNNNSYYNNYNAYARCNSGFNPFFGAFGLWPFLFL